VLVDQTPPFSRRMRYRPNQKTRQTALVIQSDDPHRNVRVEPRLSGDEQRGDRQEEAAVTVPHSGARSRVRRPGRCWAAAEQRIAIGIAPAYLSRSSGMTSVSIDVGLAKGRSGEPRRIGDLTGREE